MSFIEYLHKHFPVLFSPRFHGVFMTALFQLALTKGWMDQYWMEFFRNVFGLGTALGSADWLIKKTQSTVHVDTKEVNVDKVEVTPDSPSI